jgi:hypothetical protein
MSFGCADGGSDGPVPDGVQAVAGRAGHERPSDESGGSSVAGGEVGGTTGGGPSTGRGGASADDSGAADEQTAASGGNDARQDGGMEAEGTNKAALCGPGGSAIFCDGFENATLDSAWNPVSCDPVKYPGGNPNATGSQQRDTLRSSSGLASWHAHVDFGSDPPAGGSCQAELRRSVTFPTPDAFLRAFVYVPAGNVPFEFNMLTDTHGFFAVGLDYPLGPLHAGGYDSQGSPVNGSSMAAFPTDRWVCVEWQLHQGSSPAITVWQEGVTVIDRAAVTFAAGARLDGLFFGIYVGNAQNAKADIWLDDVALSATRIGCTGH